MQNINRRFYNRLLVVLSISFFTKNKTRKPKEQFQIPPDVLRVWMERVVPPPRSARVEYRFVFVHLLQNSDIIVLKVTQVANRRSR